MGAVNNAVELGGVVLIFKGHRHTRMPVYDRDIDHVVGLIHTKDLLLFYTLSSSQNFDMDKLLRPIEFTPEQKKVDELLHAIRTKNQHVMPVSDEHGGNPGPAT